MNLDTVVFGYLILSSTKTLPTLPPLDRIKFRSSNPHIEAAYYGTVLNSSAIQPIETLVPHRGRQSSLFALSQTMLDLNPNLPNLYLNVDQNGVESSFEEKIQASVRDQLEGSYFFVYESRGAQSFVNVLAKDVSVSFYGVYCDSFSLLVWTNLSQYSWLARSYTEEPLWVQPFEPRTDLNAVLHAQHLCSRWYRWERKGLPVGKRFSALERYLFD